MGNRHHGKIIKGDPMTNLSNQQISCMDKLPADHEVVSGTGRTPIVRQPDGQLWRIRPSGSFVAAVPVERVQSYLRVHG
jgi:hypothetical protein